MMIDFAGRLKRLRIEKGYSQATLAKKITDAGQKLGEASIAKYENGRTYPNLQTAACWRIASVFQSIILPVARKPRSFRLTV